MSIYNSKKMRFYHFRDCKYIEKTAHSSHVATGTIAASFIAIVQRKTPRA